MKYVYEPAEDSFFLGDFVKKHAKGSVLDMGSGSGFLGEIALGVKGVKSVVFSDVCSDSVSFIKSKGFDCKKSNLFSGFKDERFDTIIFNPPYLPEDKNIKDHALYGGKKGFEVIDKFLSSVDKFLSKNGRILLLFSSLTNKSVVEDLISKYCFKFSLLGSKKLFMESLFVVQIEKSDVLKKLNENNISNVARFDKGKRSIVFSGILNKKKVAVKVETKLGGTKKEVDFLKVLNKNSLGPKLLFFSKNFFCCDFIDGVRILDFLEKSSKKDGISVLKECLLQCRKLDLLFVEKDEMTNPYKHILVVKKKVFFIDFERCKEKKFPSNVTQFSSFLLGANISKILKKKNIVLDRNGILDCCKVYKKDQSEKNFKVLLSYLNF